MDARSEKLLRDRLDAKNSEFKLEAEDS